MGINRRKFISESGTMIAGSLLLPQLTFAEGAVLQEEMPLKKIKTSNPKRILLRSGWAVSNIGDIGHTPGTLHILERHFPEAEITLWPLRFNAEIEAMIRKRFPKVKIIEGPFVEGEGKPIDPKIIAAFEETDFFLYNSGMHFNYGLFSYQWDGLIRLMTHFYICQKFGKPYGLYGHSFDLWEAPSPFVFAPILNNAAFIYCRDMESLKYLKENNIKAGVMEFAPDGCFGIDTLDEDKATAYLNANNLKEDDFMTLIIRSYTPKPDAERNKLNMLNPTQPTPQQIELDKKRFAKINTLVTTWVRHTKKKVLLAPEVFKEIAAAKKLVIDQQPGDVKPYLVYRDTFWNADEALSVFKRARLVVGMEPHSLIMALAVGVPVVHTCPFTFGKKGWMFKDIGLTEWLFDIDKDSVDPIISTLLNIDNDYLKAKEKVSRAMQFVQQRQEETVAVLKKTIV